MPSYQYGLGNETTGKARKLFGRERPIHQVLGGGKVADVLLWKNKKLSGGLLLGMTVIWFLFEVFEYNFVTLFCHISITTMLVFFVWRTSAETFQLTPPIIPKVIVKESTLTDAALLFHKRFHHSLPQLFDIACGRDLPIFLLTLVSLYIVYVIGTYVSFLNLLYLGFLCMGTVPFLYERYEDDVDRVLERIFRETKKSYKELDAKVLNKIPRGPVKEKKLK